jgi:hypothetical protein
MGVMDKEDVVASMADADPWDSYDIRNPTEIPLAEGVVGLVYEAKGKRDDGAADYRANILSVYGNNHGAWQLVLHQQTPIDS